MVDSRDRIVEKPPQRSLLVALGFWLCLIVSGGLYGVCALSPRIVEWATVRQRYVENQAELVALQGQTKHLGRVVDAMETDPEFAARLARSEFGGVASSRERMAVPTELDYDPRVPARTPPPDVGGLPWYVPLLHRVADDGELRLRGLAVAAGLMLFAFLFLQERSLEVLRGPRRLATRVVSRYVIANDPAPGARPLK